MKPAHVPAATVVLAALAASPQPALAADPPSRAGCVDCHAGLQPGLVSDWRLSRHAQADVACDACHGRRHASEADVAAAAMPTVETCRKCHDEQVAQFKRGDHARAWEALAVLPTFHNLQEGKEGAATGCATCHRIGIPSPEQVAARGKAGATHGLGSCDACHTRHTFSALEARQPEACKACHGDLQYEAWSQSKHGTRHAAAGAGRLPAGAQAPTCQTCHMQGGEHGVRTPLGNVALRLPLVKDQAWAADKAALLQALGVLDAAGGNGVRGEAFEEARIAELDRVGFQGDRARLVRACQGCHGSGFVHEQLDQRDQLIRQADALLAGAVREVAALYRDGVLERKGAGPFPDLVKWPSGSPPEQRLGRMFFDHRARLLAHAFHMSPQAVRWSAELVEDAAAVKRLSDELRAGARRAPAAAKGQGRAGP